MYHRTSQIKSVFQNISKPQAAVLAAFSFGVARAGFRPINAAARRLTFLGIPDTMATCPHRFIPNPRVGMAEYCANLARSAIRAPPRKKRVTALVGGTGLHDRRKAMAVSVAYEGRAVRGGDKAQGGKPLMGEKARMRARRASAALRARRPRSQGRKPAPASPRLGKRRKS